MGLQATRPSRRALKAAGEELLAQEAEALAASTRERAEYELAERLFSRLGGQQMQRLEFVCIALSTGQSAKQEANTESNRQRGGRITPNGFLSLLSNLDSFVLCAFELRVCDTRNGRR
jgi:hypothetical protein